MSPKRTKRGAKHLNKGNETPQKKPRLNVTKDTQSKIMLPSQSSTHIVYALKAIYGLIVSMCPMVAAYLHPEVTQPQEPERGELPAPAAGSLRLAANQQSLSDRQAEATWLLNTSRKTCTLSRLFSLQHFFHSFSCVCTKEVGKGVVK